MVGVCECAWELLTEVCGAQPYPDECQCHYLITMFLIWDIERWAFIAFSLNKHTSRPGYNAILFLGQRMGYENFIKQHLIFSLY